MINSYGNAGKEEAKKVEAEVMAAQVMNKEITAVQNELSRFLSTPLLRGFDEPWCILLHHLDMSPEVEKAFLNITSFELEGGKAWDLYADLLGEGTASATYGALERFWSHVDAHGANAGDGHTHLSGVLEEAASGFLSWIRESDPGYRGGGSLLLWDWSGVIDEFMDSSSGDVASSIVDCFYGRSLFRNGELEYGTSLTHFLIEASDEIIMDGWARLSSLVDAYNWEWALAAFEWGEVTDSERCSSPLANLRALVGSQS